MGGQGHRLAGRRRGWGRSVDVVAAEDLKTGPGSSPAVVVCSEVRARTTLLGTGGLRTLHLHYHGHLAAHDIWIPRNM